ncbi:MAG: hypothetical protein SNJ70_03600 [Armatimonadota bacterium]
MKVCKIILILILNLIFICSSQLHAINENKKRELMNLGRKSHQSSMYYRNIIRQSRIALNNIFNQYKLDESRARIEINRLNKAQYDLLNLHHDNQIEIRELLTESEFNEIQNMRNRGIRPVPPSDRQLESMMPLMFSPSIINQLNLTKDQKNKLSSITRMNDERSRLLRTLRTESERIFIAYSKYDINKYSLKSQINSINNIQKKLSENTLSIEKEIRKVLNESQFNKFKSLQPRIPLNRGPQHSPRRGWQMNYDFDDANLTEQYYHQVSLRFQTLFLPV